MAEIKGKRLGRQRNRPLPDVIDLRTDETIDLRSDPVPAGDDYHCMRVWNSVPPLPGSAQDEWAQSASLVDYAIDVGELRSDLRRDTPAPGPNVAAILETELDADGPADELT